VLREQHVARVVGDAGLRRAVAEQAEDLALRARADDAQLVHAVLVELAALLLFDARRALVLADALAREHAGVDDGALGARRHAERRVAHLAGLLAEDRAKQLLLGRELRL